MLIVRILVLMALLLEPGEAQQEVAELAVRRRQEPGLGEWTENRLEVTPLVWGLAQVLDERQRLGNQREWTLSVEPARRGVSFAEILSPIIIIIIHLKQRGRV
jgi:hypothetical protein